MSLYATGRCNQCDHPVSIQTVSTGTGKPVNLFICGRCDRRKCCGRPELSGTIGARCGVCSREMSL